MIRNWYNQIPQGEQLLKWGGHSASLDKQNTMQRANAESLRVATSHATSKHHTHYDNKEIWTTTEAPPWNGQ